MDKEIEVLFAGECAYAIATKSGFDICVFSSNSVTHVKAGIQATIEATEKTVKRLNMYPRQTRAFHGLL